MWYKEGTCYLYNSFQNFVLCSWLNLFSSVIRLRAGRSTSRASVSGRSEIFSFLHIAQTGSGALPLYCWIKMASSSGVKRARFQAENSPPFTVYVKNK
jgi:hypothetical protein